MGVLGSVSEVYEGKLWAVIWVQVEVRLDRPKQKWQPTSQIAPNEIILPHQHGMEKPVQVLTIDDLP